MIIVSISKRKLKLFGGCCIGSMPCLFWHLSDFWDQDARITLELVDMLRNRDVAVSGETGSHKYFGKQ